MDILEKMMKSESGMKVIVKDASASGFDFENWYEPEFRTSLKGAMLL